jgi:uncharacterized protein (TIGR03435 family)
MRSAVLLAVAFGVSQIAAQEPAAPLRFDVASVKQHQERVDPFAGGFRGGMCIGTDTVVTTQGLSIRPSGPAPRPATTAQNPHPPGTCNFARITLDEIIAEAYGVARADVERLIVGGPSWLRQDHFDIEGRADAPRSHAELRRMLQALLADRFGLRVHRETREFDGFALQTVDGRHKLRAADDSAPTGTRLSAGSVTANAIELTRFAALLQRGLAKPVVDRTGLTGRYTFTMTWTPADDEEFVSRSFIAAAAAAGFPSAPVRNGSAASLFTALQEQLGLRLHPQKVPLNVLVVDTVSHPTPN